MNKVCNLTDEDRREGMLCDNFRCKLCAKARNEFRIKYNNLMDSSEKDRLIQENKFEMHGNMSLQQLYGFISASLEEDGEKIVRFNIEEI